MNCDQGYCHPAASNGKIWSSSTLLTLLMISAGDVGWRVSAEHKTDVLNTAYK